MDCGINDVRPTNSVKILLKHYISYQIPHKNSSPFIITCEKCSVYVDIAVLSPLPATVTLC